MPTQTRRSPNAAARAEARRRARQQARSADDLDGLGSPAGGETGTGKPPERPTLLQRLIPAAAPLRDKPDPLARFTYRGPSVLRPLALAGYLLRVNPLAWLIPGAVWALAARFATAEATGFLSAFVQIGALMGAGYVGWQRPWFYGLSASLFAVVLLLVVLVVGETVAGGSVGPLLGFVLVAFLANAPMYGLTGAVAGWFGGYWRRRMAETRSLRARRR